MRVSVFLQESYCTLQNNICRKSFIYVEQNNIAHQGINVQNHICLKKLRIIFKMPVYLFKEQVYQSNESHPDGEQVAAEFMDQLDRSMRQKSKQALIANYLIWQNSVELGLDPILVVVWVRSDWFFSSQFLSLGFQLEIFTILGMFNSVITFCV